MKHIMLILVLGLLLAACRKGEEILPVFYTCGFGYVDSSDGNINDGTYQNLLDNITANGVVGIEMAVYNNTDGMWVGASGKADLFNDVDMQACNITRVGSTVKMFTTTTVLLLQEEGKLNINDNISDYLDGIYIDKIENASIATIEQLMHHSSGIYNYIHNLQFQTASLNDLLKPWEAEELLQYAYNKPAYFTPGDDVTYSNTNYILLGLLIEKIEGKPLYHVFDEKIFQPLGLSGTMFAGKNPVPDGIVRGYIDIYSNLQVIESTYYSGWDYYTADGGLISTAYDLNIFLRALMQGQIINSTSLTTMLSWQTPKNLDPEFYDISYGLGIFKMITPMGECYFHSGDAIGYYANMMYFPEDSTTVVYAVNSNYGKIDAFVSTKDAITNILNVTKQ